MWALALMPVLSTLSAAPIAVLRRSLKFKQLAIRSILGLYDRRRVRHRACGGGPRGLGFGAAGAGAADRRARDRLDCRTGSLGLTWSAPDFHELRPVALNVFGARIMAMMNGQLPRLVLGFVLGPTDVGLFALGSRFHDIIRQYDGCAADGGGADRAARGEDRLCGIPARFRKDGAERIHPVVPIFPRNGGACAEPVPFMAQTTMAGRHCSPAQLIVLGGVPIVLFYSFDAALLAGNLSSVVRRIGTLQAVTVAATVLCAAPFGLIATCLALAVRPWLLLPVVFVIFRHATNIPIRIALLPSLRALLARHHGRADKFTSRPSALDERRSEFALRVIAGIVFYFSYLFIFAAGSSSQFAPVLERFRQRLQLRTVIKR